MKPEYIAAGIVSIPMLGWYVAPTVTSALWALAVVVSLLLAFLPGLVLPVLDWFDKPFLKKWVGNLWVTAALFLTVSCLWGWAALEAPDGTLVAAYKQMTAEPVQQSNVMEETWVEYHSRMAFEREQNGLKPEDCVEICGEFPWDLKVSSDGVTSCVCKSK